MTQCPYCGHKMHKQRDICPIIVIDLINSGANKTNVSSKTSMLTIIILIVIINF